MKRLTILLLSLLLALSLAACGATKYAGYDSASTEESYNGSALPQAAALLSAA